VSPTAGPTGGGTTVTITGTGFTGASAVDFGATPATSFTVNSDTQITATSPAHSAGAVDITVVTPWATSATGSADQFTYVAPPTVTGVSRIFEPMKFLNSPGEISPSPLKRVTSGARIWSRTLSRSLSE